MAITTYAELQTAVANWIDRSDLTARVPEFIALAEAAMQHDVRHWRMENRAELTTGARYVAVPTDWAETIRLTVDGDYRALELLSATEMADRRMRSGDSGAEPRFYRHVDQGFELFPTPPTGTVMILEYVAKIPALSDSNTTNWLLEEVPDAYLYGALMHANIYLINDVRVQQFAALFSAAVSRLNEVSKKARSSGTGPNLRVRGLGGGSHPRKMR